MAHVIVPPTNSLAVSALLFVCVVTSAGADEAKTGPPPRNRPLLSVSRFGYQLQKLDVAKAAASEADLLVVDPEGDGPRISSRQVETLRRKPAGTPRVILAYLSIGEAEDYRPYWRKAWRSAPPAWLGPENPDWKGNFEVKYWMADWQNVILGRPEAPLDRIVSDGYDGVYLDIVDGFEFWENRGRKSAKAEMVAWVRKIADHARSKRAGFLVVPQNGEALAAEPGYLDVIDAIGREDLYFEGDRIQPSRDVIESEAFLKRFQDAGKPVFLIEYGRRPKTKEAVIASARQRGYIPLLTVRNLDQLIVGPAPEK